MVEVEGVTDLLEIATKELLDRRYPSPPNAVYEDWQVNELIAQDLERGNSMRIKAKFTCLLLEDVGTGSYFPMLAHKSSLFHCCLGAFSSYHASWGPCA